MPWESLSKIPGIGLAVYLLLLLAGIGAFFLVRSVGDRLETQPAPTQTQPLNKGKTPGVDVVLHLTATLTAVIGVGFALGRLGNLMGQPPVVGEVLAGILLGPSFLGAIWPDGMHMLFPIAKDDPHGQVSVAVTAIAQLGVILYMFLIGLELNGAQLAGKARAAVAVSHASIIFPFILGTVLALGLYPGYSHAGVPFTSFALFLGTAMAITAFPVLARILGDRGWDKTPLGSMALACAAADDATAWCLLALVVGVARLEAGNTQGLEQSIAVVGGTGCFVVLMLFVGRPIFARVSRWIDDRTGDLPPFVVPLTFAGILVCSLTTEAIGIHALFGAFLFGVILPHDGRVAREFSNKLKDPVRVLFLPAFFAFTGMRTKIGLLDSVEDWVWCGGVILVATLGKFGGTMLAARALDIGWRPAAVLGALMNTRGLMELIVLNIGLDLGVIEPEMFTMLVVMALVTTATTTPAIQLLTRRHPVFVEGAISKS